LKVTNALTTNTYTTQTSALKCSASKSLEKVVSTLTSSQTQSVNSDDVRASDDSDYLDTDAAKSYQKTLLVLSTENPVNASDINDLDTLNAVDNDLKCMNDVLTKASDDTISKEDRDQYQKMIDYYKKSLDSIGDAYMGKVRAAKKENDANAVKLVLKTNENNGDTAETSKETLETITPEKMTDIVGVSQAKATTAKDADASLSLIDSATNSVDTQINSMKSKIRNYVQKTKLKSAQNTAEDPKANTKSEKEVLQLVKSDMSKDQSTSLITQVSGSKFSKTV
jgi:hypothetical protein